MVEELCRFRFGLEREALRVTTQGAIAQTPHPLRWGHPAAHPKVTLDFAEQMVEFVTGVHNSAEHAVNELDRLVACALLTLDGSELIWPWSVPPPLSQHPTVAQFGQDAASQVKETYRRGLLMRYSAAMQMVCGVHANVSFDDQALAAAARALGHSSTTTEARNAVYGAGARWMMEHAWLFSLLFGASPIMHRSYVGNRPVPAGHWRHDEYVTDAATTIRLGVTGYTSAVQSRHSVSFDSVDRYARDLCKAALTVEPAYSRTQRIRGGRLTQLSRNVLQMENEYYAPVRIKTTNTTSPTLSENLVTSGAEYLEMRVADVDPWTLGGANPHLLHFCAASMLAGVERESRAERVTSDWATASSRSLRAADAGATADMTAEGLSVIEKMQRDLTGAIEPLQASLQWASEIMRGGVDRLPATRMRRQLETTSLVEAGMSAARSTKQWAFSVGCPTPDIQRQFAADAQQSRHVIAARQPSHQTVWDICRSMHQSYQQTMEATAAAS